MNFPRLLLMTMVFLEATSKADDPPKSPILQEALDEAVGAARAWEKRQGPRREVVDVVCLVSDWAGYLDALSHWDDRHWFPILFNDVETSSRFIASFRPRAIIRIHPSDDTTPNRKTALEAVGRSWTKADDKPPRADRPPQNLGATPPGAVLVGPNPLGLAGALALAAGRFQPLLEFESKKRYSDILTLDEVKTLAQSIRFQVREAIPQIDALGDDCDFLTLTGDWPYRYDSPQGALNAGNNVVDEWIVRREENPKQRWAFAGRLINDRTLSVYQAMCSLFLQPGSALTFNSYSETSKPWSYYSLKPAVDELKLVIPKISSWSEPKNEILAWHEGFGGKNPYGLVLVNTSGGPTSFNLPSGAGQTADIPWSESCAVIQIHSYSAANPMDPDTLAGRWLVQGAFLYFGSMNEPYLMAFRQPAFFTWFAARGVPFGAALRQTEPEQRSAPWKGEPWRLAYWGDPLFALSTEKPKARLEDWEPVRHWTRDQIQPRSQPPQTQVWSWALAEGQAAIAKNDAPRMRMVAEFLLDRFPTSSLPPGHAPDRLRLAVQLGMRSQMYDRLQQALDQAPFEEMSSDLNRVRQWLLMDSLHQALRTNHFELALKQWASLMSAYPNSELMERLVDRLEKQVNDDARRSLWKKALQDALKRSGGTRSAPEPLKQAAKRQGLPPT